jgi:hypothetical protein
MVSTSIEKGLINMGVDMTIIIPIYQERIGMKRINVIKVKKGTFMKTKEVYIRG